MYIYIGFPRDNIIKKYFSSELILTKNEKKMMRNDDEKIWEKNDEKWRWEKMRYDDEKWWWPRCLTDDFQGKKQTGQPLYLTTDTWSENGATFLWSFHAFNIFVKLLDLIFAIFDEKRKESRFNGNQKKSFSCQRMMIFSKMPSCWSESKGRSIAHHTSPVINSAMANHPHKNWAQEINKHHILITMKMYQNHQNKI